MAAAPTLLTHRSPILQSCAALAAVGIPLHRAGQSSSSPAATRVSNLCTPWPGTAPSTLTTTPGCCQCWSLTMGAPRWPTRAGLGGSWFSSMMQGEVIARGARYSPIITIQYTSSRNTLRPAGRDREDRVVRYRGSVLQAVRNKPRLLQLALTYGCPRSGTASPTSGTLQIYSWPTACTCTLA